MRFAVFAPILLTLASAAPTKRSTTCAFPKHDSLVAVTPSKLNGGWAMSPDQECTAGSYCPYACPPGQVMAQWDPAATSYTYPLSMNGGLYCNDDGSVSKPFPDNAYCVNGTGMVEASNKGDDVVSFCQTVLPGNEAMLIPTAIKAGKSKTLAVPDTSYWASTSAHYYINPIGVSAKEGCVWGTKEKAIGNWAPYVGGANTDDSGKTFVKIAWNPVYIDQFTDVPAYGVRVTCDGGECQGLPCEIDPLKTGFNGVKGSLSKGDGASFCVVTAEKGTTAKIEVFAV